MKLKEKFLDHVYCFMGSGMLTNTYDEDIANWNAEKCEKISDKVSIKFAEWIYKNKYNMMYYVELDDVKQLLDKFKQEKGL